MRRFTTSLFLALLLVFPALARAQNSIAQADKDFMTDAAKGGMAEVKLGELASTRGQDASVKSFGKKMVTDHSAANDKLKALAAKKGLVLPTALTVEQQQKYDDLAKLSGADFDKAYMEEMVKDHDEDVTLFEKASRESKDKDIKDFATMTLPTLRTHQQMAHGYSSTKHM
jgi:putative membrane protein